MATEAPHTLYVDNDVNVYLPLVELNGEYADGSNATLSMTVEDTGGTTIVSSTSMSYVPESNGVFKASIQDTESITDGTEYNIHITGDVDGNDIDVWIHCVADKRWV